MVRRLLRVKPQLLRLLNVDTVSDASLLIILFEKGRGLGFNSSLSTSWCEWPLTSTSISAWDCLDGGPRLPILQQQKNQYSWDSVGLQSTITNGVLTTDKMRLRLRKVSLIPLQSPLLIWYEVVWNQYMVILIPVATRKALGPQLTRKFVSSARSEGAAAG